MLNHVELLGRLAQDPELRTTNSNISVVNFDLAVPVYGKDKETPPDYIPVVLWRSLADRASKYLHKGKQVVIEGRIRTRKYKDDRGKERKIVEVHATDFHFVDNKVGGKDDNANYQIGTVDDYAVDLPEVSEDDLPF